MSFWSILCDKMMQDLQRAVSNWGKFIVQPCVGLVSFWSILCDKMMQDFQRAVPHWEKFVALPSGGLVSFWSISCDKMTQDLQRAAYGNVCNMILCRKHIVWQFRRDSSRDTIESLRFTHWTQWQCEFHSKLLYCDWSNNGAIVFFCHQCCRVARCVNCKLPYNFHPCVKTSLAETSGITGGGQRAPWHFSRGNFCWPVGRVQIWLYRRAKCSTF